MQDLFTLEGRTALVTGGSRGIGEMIAEGFVRAGAKVYISARKAQACEETARRLSAFGQCIAIPADASGAAGARALAASYLAREAKLDILVNNAGAAWGAEIETFPESGWDKVMDLNVKAPFFLIQALLGALRSGASPQRPAKVINIASIDGLSVNMQDTYSYGGLESRLDSSDQAARPGARAREHRRFRDRARRVRLEHEQTGAGPRRGDRQAHSRSTNRDPGGYGRRRDIPRLPRGRLCRRSDIGRRRRRRLDPPEF